MSLFSRLFSSPDYSSLIASGVPIIDVRTPGEFDTAALPGSINSPLQGLEAASATLDKTQPIIVVCASGVRSLVAKKLLQSQGFKTVHNGGSWGSLLRYFPD